MLPTRIIRSPSYLLNLLGACGAFLKPEGTLIDFLPRFSMLVPTILGQKELFDK
jgi:hypothetical protein